MVVAPIHQSPCNHHVLVLPAVMVIKIGEWFILSGNQATVQHSSSPKILLRSRSMVHLPAQTHVGIQDQGIGRNHQQTPLGSAQSRQMHHRWAQYDSQQYHGRSCVHPTSGPPLLQNFVPSHSPIMLPPSRTPTSLLHLFSSSTQGQTSPIPTASSYQLCRAQHQRN